MAAELARERRACFEALGEDVGVACAPHDGFAAMLLDVFFKGEGALYVEDDVGAGFALKGFAGVEDHVHIGPDDVAAGRL